MPAALAAITVGVADGPADEFQGRAILSSGRSDEAAGALQNSLTFAGVGRAAFYSRHGEILSGTFLEPEALTVGCVWASVGGLAAKATCRRLVHKNNWQLKIFNCQFSIGLFHRGGSGFAGRFLGRQGSIVGDLVGLEFADAHHLPHVAGMSFEEHFRLAQATAFVPAAAAHQVGSEAVMALQLAGLADFESLRHSLVG